MALSDEWPCTFMRQTAEVGLLHGQTNMHMVLAHFEEREERGF